MSRFAALDFEAAKRASARQDVLTKPRHSLGELEEIPRALAAIQGTDLPVCRPAAALVFAADHPVCSHGVSAYPIEVTAAMIRNFVAGGAAASVAARSLDVPLHVVDVGVAHPYERTPQTAATIFRDPVADDAEGDLRTQDAMSPQTVEKATSAGRAAVDRLATGTRVLLLGEMGIGNTTLASAMTCAFLCQEPDAMVGRGTGVNDAQLAAKRAVVRDAVARVRDRSPMSVLKALGGREIAALYGAMERAGELGICILIDGFIVSAAALALARARPDARDFMLFAHRSREPGHEAVLRALNARPLLDLSMALGEASGSLAALPLLDLACALHRGMATFAEAGVPNKE